MSKTTLHELIAVEGNLKGQSHKTRLELLGTLKNKTHLFEGKRTTFTSNEEGKTQQVEKATTVQTTVAGELHWISPIIAKWIDAGLEIDEANTRARGNIIIEDEPKPILENVPTTFLLQLEHRLAEFKELLEAVATLDPSKGFKPSQEDGPGMYRATDIQKTRTAKKFVPLILYAATDKHPAQVKEGFEDKPTGEILEQEWSALVTPATKADMLGRVDKLLRAVKRARSVANRADYDERNEQAGKKIFDYILSPLPKVEAKKQSS